MKIAIALFALLVIASSMAYADDVYELRINGKNYNTDGAGNFWNMGGTRIRDISIDD